MTRIINNWPMKACILYILLLTLIAVFADFFAPNDPFKQDHTNRLKGPSFDYPLGTDQMGRCIFSRIIYGARISLFIGIIVVCCALFIGLTLGTFSGYCGGFIDEALMRFVDSFFAFPGMLLALAIVAIFGGGTYNLILALILTEWTSYARLARGAAINIKENEYIKASKGLGIGDLLIIRRHIIPNTISPIIVMSTIGIGYVILSISGMSFLGLGVQPPTPEWGSMLNDGRLYIRSAPQLMLFPGMAIMITVLVFNFLGDGFRDAIDPKMKRELR
jgi:peptide/nickel transport system permease protein